MVTKTYLPCYLCDGSDISDISDSSNSSDSSDSSDSSNQKDFFTKKIFFLIKNKFSPKKNIH